MSLDDQLAEILTSLGVTMETAETAERDTRIERAAWASGAGAAGREERQRYVNQDDWLDDWGDEPDSEESAPADISLFQTSREHYGVFYRLDLVSGAPQLRVFAPDEEGALKMRCYLVRPVEGAPVREWFRATRDHEGSAAYGAGRETIEQHLLFAAGEALKRLFWAGEPESMRFPAEIAVRRVA
ncbi:MAG TPA: hypothetical protein VFQ25_00540 [Ktedonobacterales bacterium]|nr:hypothetical protein [Ktedonobacterales bacterium]